MNLSLEELELRAFDPPHLGMPGWSCQAGRWEEDGRFMEIFVAEREGRIIDVGFLTNIPGDGLVCASVYCDEVLEKTVEEARALCMQDILALFPSPRKDDSALHDILKICVDAGVKSISACPHQP
ncbi:iron-sulfur cluster assembly scaffold protein [Desulfomicrobium sp. ZS1]|jgi:NifU-like protein involved in Fe-S cluster formation|uniref:iron-sulfur cluster assembly scaffold protein n=1 Tax=Desulfomicrobium sp. ZS1 TaxID=2952228 RepID=UPI0020B264D3|nr:iron-sulfur cluster assembly scaffold protein [Desulfomicrobium sp. ZS1]UTF51418.1 iron-sulfur cluster assembly scaffold protein [Desulfomicrobium sp. ZS1]